MPKSEPETFECTVGEVFTLFCGLPLVPDSFACRKRLSKNLLHLTCPVEETPAPDGDRRQVFSYMLWLHVLREFAAEHVFVHLRRECPGAGLINDLIKDLPATLTPDKHVEIVTALHAQADALGIDMDFIMEMPKLPLKERRKAKRAYNSNDYKVSLLRKWGWIRDVATQPHAKAAARQADAPSA